MTKASSHDEQMKDLMGTKVFVIGVEYRKLQGVDHAAQGVDDPSG